MGSGVRGIRGLDRTGLAGYLVATAYNLVRMAKLMLNQGGKTPVVGTE